MKLSRVTGFLQGVIEVNNESDTLSIQVLNEYMQASKNGEVLAAAPDIITMIHAATIISSDMAIKGMSVAVHKIDAPKVWLSEKGLKLLRG